MARFKTIVSNFLSGEISPKALGRTDLQSYANSCEKLENMITYPQGGAGRRPGSIFLSNDSLFSSEEDVRIIPFTVSKSESYLVIITKNKDLALLPYPDYGVRLYNAATDTLVDFRYTDDVATVTNERFQGYESGDDLSLIQYAQNGSFIVFTHPDRPPWYISSALISGVTGYALQSYIGVSTRANKVPYATENINTFNTITSSGTTGTVTVTGSSLIGGWFTSDIVGMIIRVTDSTGVSTGYLRVTGYTNSTTITCVVDAGTITTVATYRFSFQAWGFSYTTVNGTNLPLIVTAKWPRACAFNQNRLFFAGTDFNGKTIWGSKLGSYTHIRNIRGVDETPSTVQDTDAFAFELFGPGQLDRISWLLSTKNLFYGTEAREGIISGGAQGASITPSSISSEINSAYGSKYIQATEQDNALVFIRRNGREVKELAFNFAEDAYKAADISILSEHLPSVSQKELNSFTVGEIAELQKQDVDIPVIWCRDTNGGLFGFTRNRELGVSSAHRHIFGGDLDGEAPKVLSIAVAPSPDGNHDDLYLMIRRTTNGSNVTYLERMTREFDLDVLTNDSTDIQFKPVFSDSAILIQNGSPDTTITGLTHLEGESVVVVGDGFYLGEYTVSGGEIELTQAVTECVVGLNYISTLKTVNLDAGSVLGSSQGTFKRFDEITIRFNRAIGAKFGPEEDKLDSIEFRPATLPMQDPIPLFSGDKTLRFREGFYRYAQVVIKQDLPLPMQVTSIALRGTTND